MSKQCKCDVPSALVSLICIILIVSLAPKQTTPMEVRMFLILCACFIPISILHPMLCDKEDKDATSNQPSN